MVFRCVADDNMTMNRRVANLDYVEGWDGGCLSGDGPFSP